MSAPWANRNWQQYRLSHFRWTQSSEGGAVSHRYLLAAKQPQAQPSILRFSRVAVSTAISKLSPVSPILLVFHPVFLLNGFPDPHLLPLPESSSLHPLTPLFSIHYVQLHCSLSHSKSLSMPRFLYWSTPFIPELAFVYSEFESCSFCFYLKLLFFKEVLLFKHWWVGLQQTAAI